MEGLNYRGKFAFQTHRVNLTVGSKFTIFSLFYVFFRAIFQVEAPGELIFGGAI